MIRLDKLLANMGLGTRKQVKKAIKDGEVAINGQIVYDQGFKLDPDKDRVIFSGMEVFYQEHIYLMLNKPQGYVSSTEDPYHPSVFELIDPYYYSFDPHLVGRLDVDTTGLLLISSDGQLTHQLTNPKKGVVKVYEALVEGRLGQDQVQAFQDGIYIADDYYTSRPAQLDILQRGSLSLSRVYITEGKYHQVKKMFAALGFRVLELKRLAMGPISLDENLEEGDYRELSEEEVSLLKEA